MGKMNCWEYYSCGREAGGINTKELGVCPASTKQLTSGINGGTNSGRYCWTVSNTLCNDKVQGDIEDKLLNCINCSFFKSVNYDEGREFQLICSEFLKND
ncbi:two-CW domain-containing protein [Labilibaculum sp.]|uniref:two-CW domain-containing protein n=1 Tax=Labilibaculum sp. TaxID=2060723 RepID=UPI003566E68E